MPQRPRRAIATPRAGASLLAGLVTVVLACPAQARVLGGGPPGPAPIHAPQGIDASQRIDANQISMVVKNTGSFAYDTQNGAAGLEFPKGSGKTAVFAAGLWLGARVGGQVRIAVSEYSDEFGPGSMVGGIADDPARPEYKVYKLLRYYPTVAERDAALLDYNTGAVPHGAPPVLVLGDGSLSIHGDQMLWCVFNDADPTNHRNGAGATPPLGVEIQLSVFAYTQPDPSGPVTRTVFLHYKILNKGANTLQALHIGMWADPDLGGATDDLVGCDTARQMGYVYNAATVDEMYGAAPPALGFDLLRGPLGAGGTPQGMTAFSRYINGGGPFDAGDTYNALTGLGAGGAPVIDPTTGLPTPFMVPGDPVTGQGWLDAPPSDRRLLLSTGPVDLSPGQTQEVDYAIVIGQGSNRLSSVLSLRCDDDAIQALFDRSFAPPLPAEPDCPQFLNCPRPADYWYRQFALGGGDFSPAQLGELAHRVDLASAFLDWAADPVARLRAALDPGALTDARSRALREFSAFLCNFEASSPPIVPSSGPSVFLDAATPVACAGLTAQTIGGLAETAVRGLSDASYLDVGPHPPALAGYVDAGLPLFGGGAGYAADLFGSSIPTGSPGAHSVEIRFTGGPTGQYAYRYLRTLDSGGNRVYEIQDYVPVPFVVWDLDDNIQLNAAFLENAGPPPSPTLDSAWDPDESANGERELLWVMNSPYSGAATPEARYFDDPNLRDILTGQVDLRYVLWARLTAAGAVIDAGDRFRFTWGGIIPGPGVDAELFGIADLAPGDPAAALGYDQIANCLAAVNGGIGIGATCDRPTPALISVAGMDLAPDHVTIRWYAGGTVASGLQVERREGGAQWVSLREVLPDGSGMIEFRDADVREGGSYSYRLRVTEGGGVRWLGEVSIVVPLENVLRLEGFHPNPAGRDVQVAFTLASRNAATLTVFDVAGRRVFSRDVGALGPGPHVVPLDRGRSLASGIYVLQLTQSGRTVTRRAAVIR